MRLEKLPVSRIRYAGIVDFDGLYRMMHQWFLDRSYYLEEQSWKYKIPTPLGKHMEIEWDAWKKVTEYALYRIHVYFYLMDVKEIEVVRDGKKEKRLKLKMNLEISSHVEMEYQNRVTTPLQKVLYDVLYKTLLRRDMDIFWTDHLWYIVFKLHTEIKKFLGMETTADPYRAVW